MRAIGDLFDIALRWISLALIAAILAAEGHLLFNRYLYGPLNVIDWSGRVMTLEGRIASRERGGVISAVVRSQRVAMTARLFENRIPNP
jgi:hypothetical protein